MATKENKIVEALRAEAARNPAFSAVCHAFAMRQRTRFKVTVGNLAATMKKEGFQFAKEQYAEILKFLHGLGIGTLVVHPKKGITALDHIQVTLQSIGKAAVGGQAEVKRQTPAHKFTELKAEAVVPQAPKAPAKVTVPKLESLAALGEVDTPAPKAAPPAQPKTAPKEPQKIVRDTNFPAFLTVLIDGKLVAFPGPTNIKSDNLGEFLVKFKELAKDAGL